MMVKLLILMVCRELLNVPVQLVSMRNIITVVKKIVRDVMNIGLLLVLVLTSHIADQNIDVNTVLVISMLMSKAFVKIVKTQP